MELAEALEQERRARLAAERLLAVKQSELSDANRKLSSHARSLSEQIIEKREENDRVHGDLVAVQSRLSVLERRLWTSIASIQDGFAVFDADGVMVAANPAWLHPFDGVEAVAPGVTYEQILQIAADEGVIDIGDARPAEWKQRMLTRWAQPRIEPIVVRLWNGTSLRLLDRRSEGGDVLSLALNITGAMRQVARLKDARTKAEAASRAKSAFLANMSHELRTPMTGVVGMADLLAETTLDGEQRGLVETIRSSAEALLVVVNDVLDVSRLDAGRMVLHPEPFDLEEVIHDVVRLVQPQVKQAGIALLVDYDMFLPTRFTGDRGRVRQVLTNLIGNAVKFTREGHVLIRATGIEVDQGPHQVHLTVEDTGIGIATDMLDHIFGEFTQVEDATNRTYEGTGLGLAISRRLVQAMDGEIWVDSTPGQGSVFGFRLPLAAAEAALPPFRGQQVAVVRPDRMAAGVLAGQLRALGLQVTSFQDGAALLDGMDPNTTLVIAEADLPDTTASALAAELAPRGIPLVSLLPPGNDVIPPGLAGILQRPVRRADLRTLLEQLIPEAPPAPPRRMRVLAAEDNRTNQMILERMLSALDIDLRFAANGRLAVEAHAEWPPDLIFMDISGVMYQTHHHRQHRSALDPQESAWLWISGAWTHPCSRLC